MASPIIGKARIAAELWNELFSELDGKLTVALDGKSPFLVEYGRFLPLFGKPFVFGPDNDAIDYSIGLTAGVYDHQVFIDALADYEESEIDIWDADKHIAVLKRPVDSSFISAIGINPSLQRCFDQSLQAHTVLIEDVPHWIYEPSEFAYVPEKKWKYAQAEIVIEGMTSLTWDPAWDKYNFFRIHNLNASMATVDFGGGVQVVIPRWSCRTIRRKDGVYTPGFNYLHRMMPGDPRELQQVPDHTTPWGSMASNNAFCPSICYGWIDRFLPGEFNSGVYPLLWSDPTIINNIIDLYPGIFPAIADSVPIGDLLHHKGKLISIKIDNDDVKTEEEITFNGYESLAATLAPFGIIATENADGSFKLVSSESPSGTHDLWGIGTNLLSEFADNTLKIRPGVDLKHPVTLSNHAAQSTLGSPDTPLKQVVADPRTAAYSYSPLGGPDGSGGYNLLSPSEIDVTYDRSAVVSAATSPRNYPLRMLDWTIGNAKSLFIWDGPETNDRVTISGNAATLTPAGLVISWREQVNLRYLIDCESIPYGGQFIDGAHFQDIDALWDENIDLITASSFVFTRSVTFESWGWATKANQAFLSPRRGHRYIADTPAEHIYRWSFVGEEKELVTTNPVHHHPNIIDELEGTDGEDWSIKTEIDKPSERAAVSILTPLPLESIEADYHHFKAYRCPDVLKEFLDEKDTNYAAKRSAWLANTQSNIRIARCNLLREQFNMLSALVNSLTKARPLLFTDWSPLGFGEPRLLPNSIGPFNGPYFPADMYCSFTSGSNEHLICQALGIPVRTEADLPGDYNAIKNTKPKRYSVKTDYQIDTVLTNTQHLGGSPPKVKYTYDQIWSLQDSEIAFRVDAGSLLAKEVFEGSSDDTTFLWCKIGDVKAAAESRGFLFHFQRLGIPHKLAVFELAGHVSRVQISSETYTEQTSETLDYVWNGSAYVPPPPSYDGMHLDLPVEHDFDSIAATNGPARFALMTQSVEHETPTWLRERIPFVRHVIMDFRAGDRLTKRADFVGTFATVVYLLTIAGPDEYRFLRQQATLRADPEAVYRSVSMYHQNFRTAGLVSNEWVIIHEIPSVEHSTEFFSEESYKSAIGRLQHGPVVIPIEELEADVEATPAVTNMTLQGQIIVPIGPKAYEVILFRGWLTAI